MSTWYQISNVDEIDSPALLVYPDRIRENITRIISMVPPARLRPHIKTHKMKEVAAMQIAAGITKYKCATIAEAEILGVLGASDVLIAYQPTKVKAQRLVKLINAYPDTRFSCLVDNLSTARMLSTLAQSYQITIDVYIDLNVGMNRTGIEPEEAYALVKQCDSLGALQVIGLHAYDGHIHHPDVEVRRSICEPANARVEALYTQLQEEGYQLTKAVGGSPSFTFHAQRPDVECSPGTFVFWDKGYLEECPEQDFLPAAVLLTRVISKPTPTTICIDLGYKSIASENTLNRRVHFLNAPNLQPKSHSEEHMVIEVGENHTWQVGDVLYGLPIHICPTVALYESVLTVENGKVTDQWEVVARNRKIAN